MQDVSTQLKLSNEASQTRLLVLPLLMKGHIAELSQAITEQKASSQEREVEEVQETLAEFLKLASTIPSVTVTPYVPPRPLTEKDYLGPLGCEFWGKVKATGSNACIEKPE